MAIMMKGESGYSKIDTVVLSQGSASIDEQKRSHGLPRCLDECVAEFIPEDNIDSGFLNMNTWHNSIMGSSDITFEGDNTHSIVRKNFLTEQPNLRLCKGDGILELNSQCNTEYIVFQAANDFQNIISGSFIKKDGWWQIDFKPSSYGDYIELSAPDGTLLWSGKYHMKIANNAALMCITYGNGHLKIYNSNGLVYDEPFAPQKTGNTTYTICKNQEYDTLAILVGYFGIFKNFHDNSEVKKNMNDLLVFGGFPNFCIGGIDTVQKEKPSTSSIYLKGPCVLLCAVRYKRLEDRPEFKTDKERLEKTFKTPDGWVSAGYISSFSDLSSCDFYIKYVNYSGCYFEELKIDCYTYLAALPSSTRYCFRNHNPITDGSLYSVSAPGIIIAAGKDETSVKISSSSDRLILFSYLFASSFANYYNANGIDGTVRGGTGYSINTKMYE